MGNVNERNTIDYSWSSGVSFQGGTTGVMVYFEWFKVFGVNVWCASLICVVIFHIYCCCYC